MYEWDRSQITNAVSVLFLVVGGSIAILWSFALVRTHRRPAFDGKGRVEAICVAFIATGLITVLATAALPR